LPALATVPRKKNVSDLLFVGLGLALVALYARALARL